MNRRQARLAAIACLALLWPLPHAQAEDLQQHLRDQYQNKIFIFHAPNSGNSLHFDSAGKMLEGSAGEDWTTDSVVQVEELKVSGQRLEIRARRLHLAWVPGTGLGEVHDFDRNRKPDKDEKKNRSVRIVADLKAGDVSSAAADAAFAQVFLTSRDNFADLVPDYWKPCIRAALGDDDANKYPGCRFSPTLLAVPGIALHPGEAANDQSDAESGAPSEGRIWRVGKGVTPPGMAFTPEPEYSDPARVAHVQGSVTLDLIVNREGLPTKIRIMSPIGCGLDAKAVQAVENWKFKPAEKDGEPGAVEIAVEVEFHLY